MTEKLLINGRINLKQSFVLTLFLALFFVPMSYATDITVCDNQASPTCVTPDPNTIAQAINDADTTKNIIKIPAGTYTELSITIGKDLTIEGAGADTTIIQADASEGTATDRVFTINSSATVTIKNVTITNGNVSGNGGGILNEGDLTLENCTVSNNQSNINSEDGGGGGIYNTSELTITNCTISDNKASLTSKENGNEGGGAIYSSGTSLTVNNSTFTGNDADINGGSADGGGAILITAGELKVTNSTFSGNTSNKRGGAIHTRGTTILNNNTIVDNDGTAGGSGIYRGSGTVEIQNTIIAGNTNDDCSGTIDTFTYNLSGNGTGCPFTDSEPDGNDDNGNVTVAPTDVFTTVLDSLDDNGGPTKTHALLPNSPAIDAGDSTGCKDHNDNPITTDQLGTVRPQGDKCDIGAYEAPPSTFTLTVNTPTNGKVTAVAGPDGTAGTGINCGEGGSDCEEAYNPDTKVTLTTDPANGYAFKEWSGEDCVFDGDGKITLDKDRTCTATFGQVFTLTVTQPTEGGKITGPNGPQDSADGIDCGSNCTENYFNEEITLTAVPDSNYAIGNWAQDCATNNDGAVTVKNDNTTSCSITFVSTNNNLTITSPSNGKVTATGIDCGSTGGTDCDEGYINVTDVTLTAIPDTGYVVYSWGDDCANFDSTTGSINVNGEKTCSVMFAEARTLNVTSPSNGTVIGPEGPMGTTGTGINCGSAGSDCDEIYADGKTITLIATPDSGKALETWGDDCNTIGQVTLTGGDKTCSATFGAVAYTLTVTTPSNGKVTASGIDCGSGSTGDCEESYTSASNGSTVELIATADPNYQFDSWGDDCDSNGQVTLDGNDKTCSVTFRNNPPPSFADNTPQASNITHISFSLIVQLDKTGKVYYVVVPQGANAPTATEVENGTASGGSSPIQKGTIEVTSQNINVSQLISGLAPSTSYDIYLLTENDAGNPQTTTTKITVTTLAEYTLTVNKPNNGTVSGNGISCGDSKNDCSETYPEGTTTSLTATPNSGSTFGGWSGSCSGTAQNTSVTMTADLTCTATFNQQQTTQPKPKPKPSEPEPPPEPEFVTLVVELTGAGNGEITVTPKPTEEPTCEENECAYIYEKHGTKVTITVTPAENSTFDSWSGSSECRTFGEGTEESGNTYVYMNGGRRCAAKLNLKPQQLTLITEGNGTVSTSVEGEETTCEQGQCWLFDGNKNLTLTAIPASGFELTEWTGDDDCTDGRVTMNDQKTCTAHFAPLAMYNLTVAIEGNGTVTRNPAGIPCEDNADNCSRHFSGVTVTLASQSAATVTWGGDCDTNGQITLEADSNCTATFTATTDGNQTTDNNQSTDGTQTTDSNQSTDGTQTTDNNQSTDGTQTTDNNQSTDGTQTTDNNQSTDGTQTTDNNQSTDGTQTTDNNPSTDGTQTTDNNQSTDGTQTTDNNQSTDGTQTTDNTQNQPPITTYTLTIEKQGDGSGIVTSTPAGINCGGEPDTCSASYPEGTTVTLENLPRAGSLAQGWNEACQNGQVIMEADKTCTVTFESVGKLQFSSAPTLEIDEESGEATFTVSRIEGFQGTISVDYSTQNETATAGEDYQATNGTLTWTPGDNEDKSFTIPVLPDKLKEENETVIIALSNPGGGAILGTPSQSTLTIIDVPWISSLQFSMPSYAVNEGDGHVTLLVTRAGSSRWPLSVDYTTGQGTASANQDYTPVSGSLNWANGDRTHRTIDIEIAHDNLEESNETFLVTLSQINGEAQFGSNAQATVNIINTPAAGSLEFSASEYGVNEYLEQITIEVNRIGGNAGTVSVNYATNDATATANEDYQATQGQLTWLPDDTEPKSFTVPIIIDNIEEPKETLILTLSEPTGGASLGAKPEAIITIVDLSDDSVPSDIQTELFPGVLQFTKTSYDINERGGSVTIAVSRTVGSQGTITVSYTTEDDTALAGEEYQASQGELTWENGEMGEKRFSIGLFDDTIQENDKRFKVFLSNPTGGAVLKNNEQSAVVNIQDNDATTLQISAEANAFITTENQSEVIMTVMRNGNGLGKVSVDYETVDGTAKADQDYIATRGTLEWPSGDNYAQTVAIPIIFDRTTEDNETLQFRLSNVTNATLGTPNLVTITITESDRENCDVEGNLAVGSIDCYVILDQNAEPLQNVKIAPQGTVAGGTLGGSIQNAGWIQDVILLPQTEIYGGTIAGHITSRDPTKPGILRYVKIVAGATLEHVVIGNDSIIDNVDGLGEGVRFESNSLVSLLPPDFDLGLLLGRKAQAILGQYAVKLSDDVLYNASVNGILGAINGLPEVKSLGSVTQDEESGLLKLDIGDVRYAVLPNKVRQILKKQVNNEIPLGVYIDLDHTVRFITHTGREVITQPVVQAPDALNDALAELGLNPAIMLDNGNIKVPTPNGLYFMARASLYAIRVSTEMPLGIGFSSTSVGTSLAYLVFEDENGDYRQQFFYSAVADPDVLYAGNNPEPTIHYDGQVVIQTNTNRYEGLLDYAVTKGQQRDAGTQLLDIEDVNGDGCNDSRIDYPDGDSQIIYCLP